MPSFRGAQNDYSKRVLRQTKNLRSEVLRLALLAYETAEAEGLLTRPRLTIIDYDIPSYEKRLWVLDIESAGVLFEEWVAHGMGHPRGSGGDMQTMNRASNEVGSRMSSLGLFVTGETYQGKHGYTLRMDGMEPGFNDAARERLIVFHGAHYVSGPRAKNHLIGRSWGCPVVRDQIAPSIIDAIKHGSIIWLHFSDDAWLQSSRFLVHEKHSSE
ncbi:MAG: murein L,D-transpeptidase catalytic domain family protein [bacterium]|nr:murein L,D-transpeptidase catalytic domain family protein [bacterium]